MTTPFHEGIPDAAFPMMSGLAHQPLVSIPERGNAIVHQCRGCGREVLFSGRDICRLFPAWLTRDVWAWAAAMKCDDCASPRQAFHCISDTASQGFNGGPGDPTEAQYIRRLMAWLPDGGLRIDDVAYLVCSVDPTKLRDAGFAEDVVMLFTSPYCSTHYRPTKLPSQPRMGKGRHPEG